MKNFRQSKIFLILNNKTNVSCTGPVIIFERVRIFLLFFSVFITLLLYLIYKGVILLEEGARVRQPRIFLKNRNIANSWKLEELLREGLNICDILSVELWKLTTTIIRGIRGL